MYDFVTDPKISLHSRIKRKLARPSDIHFYGFGPNSTCFVYIFFEQVSFLLFSLSFIYVEQVVLAFTVSLHTSGRFLATGRYAHPIEI